MYPVLSLLYFHFWPIESFQRVEVSVYAISIWHGIAYRNMPVYRSSTSLAHFYTVWAASVYKFPSLFCIIRNFILWKMSDWKGLYSDETLFHSFVLYWGFLLINDKSLCDMGLCWCYNSRVIARSNTFSIPIITSELLKIVSNELFSLTFQAILKRINSKGPHYKHLDWVSGFCC